MLTPTEINNMINELVEAREATTLAEGALDTLQEEHAEVINIVNDARNVVSDAKKKAREVEGLLRAAVNNNLKAGQPIPDVFSTKSGTECLYLPEDALRWCVEHKLYNLLTLNTKKFDNVLQKAPDVIGDKFDDGDEYFVRFPGITGTATVRKTTVASVPRKLERVEA